MSEEKCKICGNPLDSGDHWKCRRKEEDIQDFEANSYTRQEIENISAASYVRELSWRGTVKAFMILPLAALGGWIGGTWFSSPGMVAPGTGGGLVVGGILGLVIARGFPLVSPRPKYRAFAKRLETQFFQAAAMGAILGGTCSIPIDNALPSVSGDSRWRVALIMALVAPLAAVAAGVLFASLSTERVKAQMLETFDEWKQSKRT
jgi:hypothetical protein